jgi:hypothetical protein
MTNITDEEMKTFAKNLDGAISILACGIPEMQGFARDVLLKLRKRNVDIIDNRIPSSFDAVIDEYKRSGKYDAYSEQEKALAKSSYKAFLSRSVGIIDLLLFLLG